MEKKNFVILLSCTVIAAFLGAFLASFVIMRPPHSQLPPQFSGQEQRSLMPGDFENVMEQQETMLEHDMEFFDKFDLDMDDLIQHSPNSAGFIQMNNTGLKISETPNDYKIQIDLKPFGKEEKNVVIKIKGNTVKISAGYKTKDKTNYSSSQFYQSITMPSKIDADAIKKEKQGDLLIITIPKK